MNSCNNTLHEGDLRRITSSVDSTGTRVLLKVILKLQFLLCGYKCKK